MLRDDFFFAGVFNLREVFGAFAAVIGLAATLLFFRVTELLTLGLLPGFTFAVVLGFATLRDEPDFLLVALCLASDANFFLVIAFFSGCFIADFFRFDLLLAWSVFALADLFLCELVMRQAHFLTVVISDVICLMCKLVFIFSEFIFFFINTNGGLRLTES